MYSHRNTQWRTWKHVPYTTYYTCVRTQIIGSQAGDSYYYWKIWTHHLPGNTCARMNYVRKLEIVQPQELNHYFFRVKSYIIIKKYHVFFPNGKISVRINLPFFSTVVPSSIFMFLSCRPFVVITLSTGLVGVEVTYVSWLGQLTVWV